MKVKIYINPHSTDSKTETSFRFKGNDKIYNSYKTEKDNYEISNIQEMMVYSDDESDLDTLYENLVSSLPKYLKKYIYKSTTTNYLNDKGYTDYSKAQPCITFTFRTNHTDMVKKRKIMGRLHNEALKLIK